MESGTSYLELKYEYYTDRNDVISHTPVISLKKYITDEWSLSYDQEIDAVTGASRFIGNPVNTVSNSSEIDGVSGATYEIRTSENLNLTYENQGTVFSSSFYMSHEADYTSYAPGISIAQDFFNRNTTLAFGYNRYFDDFKGRDELVAYNTGSALQPGDVIDRNLSAITHNGKKDIHSYSASITQSLTPMTLFSMGGNYVESQGFLGRFYYNVTLDDGQMVPESIPDQKLGVALSSSLIQGYKGKSLLGSFRLDYRFYQDSWGLSSNTIDVKWYQFLTHESYVRFRLRYYNQSKAEFVYNSYNITDFYRTADIRYYPFTSYMTGFKFVSSFPESWEDIWFIPTKWDFKIDYLFRNTKGDRSLYQFYEGYYNQMDILAGVTYEF